SYAQQKAKWIIEAAKKIVNNYGGKVPKDVNELQKLKGVGRKTAVVIMVNAFGIVPGIPVDTHVKRVSYRLGWTKNKQPNKIEDDLKNLIPKKWWKQTPWLLKAHGRAVCKAPIPECSKCPIAKLCPRWGVSKSK
ncbi:endonuclease III, partial [Candidatus Woesearchaeota archaeon]